MSFFWETEGKFRVNIGKAVTQALTLLERGVAAHEQLKEEVRLYRESRNPNIGGSKDILFQQLGIIADALVGIKVDLAPRLHSSVVESLLEKAEAAEILNKKLELDNAELRGLIERMKGREVSKVEEAAAAHIAKRINDSI